MELLLVLSSHPKNSEAALGHKEMLCHSAVSPDLLPSIWYTLTLSLCSLKVFQVACTGNFSSSLLLTYQTSSLAAAAAQQEQRCMQTAWTGSQHLHSLQGTSFDAPDRYLRQDSTYTLHDLSDRDGKGVIRKRGVVGSAVLTLVGKKWVWRLLGGLGEAMEADPGSLRGTRLVPPQPSSTYRSDPEQCWAQAVVQPGQKVCFVYRSERSHLIQRPSPVESARKKEKRAGIGMGLLSWPAGYGHGVCSLLWWWKRLVH